MSTQYIRTLYNKLFNDVALTPQEWKTVGEYLNTITPSGVPINNRFNYLAKLRRFLFLRKFSPEFIYKDSNQATSLIARIMSKAHKDKNNNIYQQAKSMLPDFHAYQIEKIYNKPISIELMNSFPEDEIFADEIDLRDQRNIAEGSFGSIFMTRSASYFTDLNENLIIKKPKDNNDKTEINNILNEIRALTHFSNTNNIIHIQGISIGKTIGIVLEHMIAGSLGNYYMNNFDILTINDKRNIAFQAVNGVHEMHSLGWLHRDLTIGNILVNINPDDNSFTIKISDVASAVNTLTHTEIEKGTVTTWAYCDRGLLINSARSYADKKPREFKYNTATDVFSLGPVLYIIFTGEPNACFYQHHELLDAESKRVKRADKDTIKAAHKHEVEMITTLANNHPDYCEADKKVIMAAPIPDRYSEIIVRCYDAQADKRPSTTEILDIFAAPIPKPLARTSQLGPI